MILNYTNSGKKKKRKTSTTSSDPTSTSRSYVDSWIGVSTPVSTSNPPLRYSANGVIRSISVNLRPFFFIYIKLFLISNIKKKIHQKEGEMDPLIFFFFIYIYIYIYIYIPSIWNGSSIDSSNCIYIHIYRDYIQCIMYIYMYIR